MSSTPTFHPYSRLPKELQIVIWELAAKFQQPQIITLSPRFSSSPQATTLPQPVVSLLHKSTNPPPLLQTCTLSRTIAQKAYNSNLTPHFVNPINFSASRDLLFFDSIESLDYFFRKVVPLGPDCGIQRAVLSTGSLNPRAHDLYELFHSLLKDQKFVVLEAGDAGEIYHCQNCKSGLPVVYGLEFHRSWNELKRHIDGTYEKIGSRMEVWAMGRTRIREEFGDGPWGNPFCEDCEKSDL